MGTRSLAGKEDVGEVISLIRKAVFRTSDGIVPLSP